MTHQCTYKNLIVTATLVAMTLHCSSDSDDDPDTWLDNPETIERNGHHPAWGTALPRIPFKAAGDPIHIGTAPIVFTDATLDSGLPEEGEISSVTFVDFDDDSWPDIVAHTDLGLTFFRNIGGKFKDVTDDVLYPQDPIRKEGGTAVFGDLNGDGNLDIYVASRSESDKIIVGDGFGHFEPAETQVGIPENKHAQGVSLADIDGDGDLDVYLSPGRRIDADELDPPLQEGFAGSPNILLLNDGTGGFKDVTAEWNATAGATSESFGSVFADYDNDNDLDLLVIRDFETDHFLRNIGGTFEDASEEVIGQDFTSLMGLAVGDFNNDGLIDIYGTNFSTDYLYQNNDGKSFTNVWSKALIGGDPTFNYTGWGCAMVDLDNDGDQDLFSIAAYEEDLKQGGERNSGTRLGGWAVLENMGDGTMVDKTGESGLGDPVNGTAMAMADYDRDGDMDFVAALAPAVDVGMGPPIDTVVSGLRLIRNDSARAAGNQFLQVNLRHPEKPALHIGATIIITSGPIKSARVVTAGESFLAANTLVQHFGLGTRKKADLVTIKWPDGNVQIAHDVPAGAHRLAYAKGDCCYPGAQCGDPYAECPLWTLKSDPCLGESDCVPCDLICDSLSECGEDRNECLNECNSDPPTVEETVCTKLQGCDAILACLDNGPGPGEDRQRGQ